MSEEIQGDLIRLHHYSSTPHHQIAADWAIRVPAAVAADLIKRGEAKRLEEKDLTKKDHWRGITFYPFRGHADKIAQMDKDTEIAKLIDEQAKNSVLSQQEMLKQLVEVVKHLAAIQLNTSNPAGKRADKSNAS